MPHLELWYDLRRPAFTRASAGELCATMLDQCAWADEHGFDAVTFGEHHSADDGYLPSPIVAAAAVAGRTKRLRLRLILLCPFYDPLRLAEDLAVLDLASGGRIIPVLAAGYRPTEFAMFGRRIDERRAAVEETTEVLKKAWTGEPFEFRGRMVRVTPKPAQSPRPPIIGAAGFPSVARRAAHIADGFNGAEHSLWEHYRAERLRLGGDDPGPLPPQGPDFLFVAENPDKAWPLVAPHILHSTNTYAAWRAEIGRAHNPRYPPIKTIDDLRASPAQKVLTPRQCIELAEMLGPDGFLKLGPLYGGLEPELSWSSLKLFEKQVLPHIDLRNAEIIRY